MRDPRSRPRHPIRSSIVVVICALLGAGVMSRDVAPGELKDTLTASRTRTSQVGFPIAWYDALQDTRGLSRIASERMNGVMPYYSDKGDVGSYLDAAQAAHVQVLLEIPRRFVRTIDDSALRSFVRTYKARPALFGWYLADEPSTNMELGPLTGPKARRLYRAIKLEDPRHPVAIALGPNENPRPYASALDVLMYDDYPCMRRTPEFGNFSAWSRRVAAASRAAQPHAFVPVIQAFGGAWGNRLPTTAEERYMVYSSIQDGAAGIFFWTRYRSDSKWINHTLTPITTDLEVMRPALAAGALSGVAAEGANVTASVFRDPRTGHTYLVVVNRGGHGSKAIVYARGPLAGRHAVVSLDDATRVQRFKADRVSLPLGRYGVTLLRVE
jgi:hypothetical protein